MSNLLVAILAVPESTKHRIYIGLVVLACASFLFQLAIIGILILSRRRNATK